MERSGLRPGGVACEQTRGRLRSCGARDRGQKHVISHSLAGRGAVEILKAAAAAAAFGDGGRPARPGQARKKPPLDAIR
jgi:hypothetical protein